MAEDKDGEAKPPAAKKRRLMPLACVLVGAALGGAGVVFLAPKPEPKPSGPATPQIEIVHYPDRMKFVFNPRVEKGTRMVRLEFALDVKQDALQAETVVESIKTNWERARSRVLIVLKDQPVGLFTNGSEGMRRLTKDLCDELTASLFPGGVAKVDDVIYTDVFVQ